MQQTTQQNTFLRNNENDFELLDSHVFRVEKVDEMDRAETLHQYYFDLTFDVNIIFAVIRVAGERNLQIGEMINSYSFFIECCQH